MMFLLPEGKLVDSDARGASRVSTEAECHLKIAARERLRLREVKASPIAGRFNSTAPIASSIQPRVRRFAPLHPNHDSRLI
jgi:hypothetical protein